MKTKTKFLFCVLFASIFLGSCENLAVLDDVSNGNEAVEKAVKYPKPGNVSGIKIISCMEINDVNPLNNISFSLKSTGKPLFDMVILFSSNINYNQSLGKPYIHHNTEMTNILANSDKYIKPLKDRGIKVMLSLLGNWDRAGVASMSAETAKEFAQQIKYTLDKYNLDGVMFDDEYSSYITPPPSGFVTPSSQAAGRLLYQTKQAIGDRLVFAYVYNRLNGQMPTINGVTPANYIDYALSDYLAGPVSSKAYTGMSNKQKAPWSQEFNLGRIISIYGSWVGASYQSILNDGYGAHLVFGLNPNNQNFRTKQLPELRQMSSVFCKDEIVYDGVVYPADYK